METRRSSIGLVVVAYMTLCFTLLPIVVLVVAAFNPAEYFTFPPDDWSFRWFAAFFRDREYQSALRVSIALAGYSVVIALAVGLPATYALSRYKFGGRNVVHTFLMSSLFLPRVIWAIALLQFYAVIDLLGTPVGLVLAHAVLVLPYVARMTLTSFAYVSQNLEQAARSLGASPARSFFEVTLPLVLPGVIVGAVFGFVISFTDVVVSVFISGVRFIPLLVRIYVEQRGQGIDPTAIAASAVVIGVIVILELLGERFIRWSRFI